MIACVIVLYIFECIDARARIMHRIDSGDVCLVLCSVVFLSCHFTTYIMSFYGTELQFITISIVVENFEI